MHRTLKEDTAKPPAQTVPAQQKKFDRFRLVFNHERPHEGLATGDAGQHLCAQHTDVAEQRAELLISGGLFRRAA